MKTLEELALGTADVIAITPKVISATIEEVARGKRVFAQIFKQNRDLVGKPGLEISFPKKGTGISAEWDVSPGGTVTASTFAYDATTIRVKKGGIRLEFTNEALEAALRDVIKDHIYEAGIVWAETIDDRAIEVALNLIEGTHTWTATSNSYTVVGSVPIWSIESVDTSGVAATINGVDYYSGTCYFNNSLDAAGTIVFKYAKRASDSGLYINAKDAKTLSAWDMLSARAKILGKNYVPTVAILHDDDIPSLLYDEKLKFLDVSAYGGREAILNAEVGKLFGMKMLTTTRTSTGHVVYIDTGDLGYEVIKRGFKGYREDKPEYDSIWYHFWAEEDFGVVNDNAIALSVNHGPTSGSLKAATANPAG